LKFGSDYWCICIICGSLYSDVDGFIEFSGDFFKKKFILSNSNSFFALHNILGAALTPIFGKIVDKYWRLSTFLFASGLILNAA